jgi:hypothetical protein
LGNSTHAFAFCHLPIVEQTRDVANEYWDRFNGNEKGTIDAQ